MKPIYLDYAATTPVEEKVFEKMKPYFGMKEDLFANPGSLHVPGQKALAAVDEARVRVAKTISAGRDQVVFVSSATEGNNLVLRGAVRRWKENNSGTPHVIVSAVEHPSVLETAKDMQAHGEVELAVVDVSSDGTIDVHRITSEVKGNTALVCVQWTNNETGVEQDVPAIAQAISAWRKEHASVYPLFHTDAVQAYGYSDCNVIKSDVDCMTLSSHKIYGPKGAAAVYIRDRNAIASVITGGDQEKGLRSGTENVPAIVGLGQAAEITYGKIRAERARLKELSEYFLKQVTDLYPDAEVNGSLQQRSPHILNVRIPSHTNLHVALDMRGVAVSAGSACSQRFLKPSHVLRALNKSETWIKESIRFSFGRYTTKEEIEEVIERIKKILKG